MQVEEKLLKKVNENLARRSQFVQAGSRDLEQINQFHTYQVAKQEKQRQHRSKVLARVRLHPSCPLTCPVVQTAC